LAPKAFGAGPDVAHPKEVDMTMRRSFTIYLSSVLVLCPLAHADGPVVSPHTATDTNAVVATQPVSLPVVSAPVEAPVASTAPADDSIEIAYIEADIQNVLRTLAAKAGVNLILGDEVAGKVTVNLKGISYQEAMQLIAESKGYAYVMDKGIVKIKSRESLDVEPVELRMYTLAYAKADDVKKTLEPVLTKQGKIQVDQRSNTLVLSDTPSNLSKLVPLIQSLDTQTPQVMIEAKFVEVTKNPQKNLGINWSNTLLNHPITAGSPLATAAGNTVTPPPSDFLVSKGVSGAITPAFATALLDAGTAQAIFSFLSQDTDSELLANPRVVTTDNQKARISISEQYPIPDFSFSEQTASLQISGFEYKDIGIILEVLPRINKNSFVTLDVTPTASSQGDNVPLSSGGGNTVNIPIINTRTATTTVLIKSGNTLAIGGLMRVDVTDTYTKVPLIGDAPILGPLFRSKSLSKTKRDLLIFLTPTIVSADAQTGYEKYVDGLPKREVYTDDKWMPHDDAKARHVPFIGTATKNPPDQNFGPN
jgi:type IV pilus assembly protein PilQ